MSTDIFDPNCKYPDSSLGINETRGGEKYIPPSGWFGYRLKVGEKYDNGNDTWLKYNDKEGVFEMLTKLEIEKEKIKSKGITQ